MADEEGKSPYILTGDGDKSPAPDGGGGWGGWGISAFSVLSDLQKAAQDISRNAVAIAKSAANEIGSAPGVEAEPPAEAESEVDSEDDKLRKSTLDKLENASDDSLLSQGLKALDSSVESFTSGAWSALGNAWKGGSTLVQKLEHSAVNLADSITQGALPVTPTSLAPSIIETGKSFTVKGMDLLERVSKEAMELLISESEILTGKNSKVGTRNDDEKFEEITFDRCFYIYGGPDQLEELEALSNHHALLFNRKKSKLLSEQKSLYDGKFRQIQQIFTLNINTEERIDPDKGKNIETSVDSFDLEMRNLLDSNVRKAADMAAGFTNALRGFALNEISQRTSDRLENVHSEGVHRLSEFCCISISKFLMLGKSIISNANKSKTDETNDILKIEWPGDSVSKAKLIRSKARSMSEDVESVSNSFSTGISDILEAYLSTLQNVASDAHDFLIEGKAVQEKANFLVSHLQASRTSAVEKIQDAVQYLAYVVISTSIGSA